MKSNELRIGNLVQDQNGNLLKVIGLTTESKSLYVVDRSKFPLPKGWKDQPIPLTEDWLVKFGFREFYCKGLKGYISDKMELLYNLDSHQIYSYNEVDGSIWNLARVKYVHQLQNLYFALTGQELEIKNK